MLTYAYTRQHTQRTPRSTQLLVKQSKLPTLVKQVKCLRPTSDASKAYVTCRVSAHLSAQHTSAYVSVRIRQHTHTSAYACVSIRHLPRQRPPLRSLASQWQALLHQYRPAPGTYVSIRQHTHTSAYVSIRIRQHTSACAYVSIRQQAQLGQYRPAPGTYVSIRQHTHTSAYVSMHIRQHTSAGATRSISSSTKTEGCRILARSTAAFTCFTGTKVHILAAPRQKAAGS
jgi:hypothetical protein